MPSAPQVERRLDAFLDDARSTPGRMGELREPPFGRRRLAQRGVQASAGQTGGAASDGKDIYEGGGGPSPAGALERGEGAVQVEEEDNEGDEDPHAAGDPTRPFTCSDGCRQDVGAHNHNALTPETAAASLLPTLYIRGLLYQTCLSCMDAVVQPPSCCLFSHAPPSACAMHCPS
jgi:hypothetical protein